MRHSDQAQPMGPRCTITIQPGEGGVMVAVEFGEALDLTDPTVTQSLALHGAEAIQRQVADLRAIAKCSGQPLHPTRQLMH
ncbi:hypothetical protein [Halomonas sp.]|uniref:hypothetical protein n=1 Tax=Halomonas sp. TaxID=1486246 RepID=UPI00298E6DF3|nr:hypothetical protein [Halomonas sp.]MDW7746559.1 hypothetical protein [Halomonas sp.]